MRVAPAPRAPLFERWPARSHDRRRAGDGYDPDGMSRLGGTSLDSQARLCILKVVAYPADKIKQGELVWTK